MNVALWVAAGMPAEWFLLPNLLYLALAVFIAWGRLGPEAFTV